MISEFSIQNSDFEVKIKAKGAELCSVKSKDTGREFIWQAGEAWPRHAPILFPVVGSLIDHEYIYEGQNYPMSHHGFARDFSFDMLHQSEHSICLVLQSDEQSMKYYPFAFTLLITYTLNSNQLNQKFRVINESDCSMPLSFGAHPAFNAHPAEDYYIEFEKEENCPSARLRGPYISEEVLDVIKGRQITLTKNIFDQDALIFEKLRSEYLSLKSRNNNHGVKVHFKGWPYIGIWSKPGAPFVCIEPWQGLADYIDHDKKIEHKKGIIWVAAKEELSKELGIELFE